MRQGLQWWTRRWLGFGHGPLGWCASLLLGLTTILVLIGAFLAWRMEQAPISLRFAIPAIEAALSPSDGSLVVRLEEFRLRRDGLRFTFEAVDMAVFRTDAEANPDHSPFATLPVAGIDLSVKALLNDGVLAPQRITAEGLLVTAERGPKGIELSLTEGDDVTSEDRISLAILRKLLRDDPRLRYLEAVELSNLIFRINDPILGIAWQTEGTSMRLVNNAEGLAWHGRVILETHSGDISKVVDPGGIAQWTVTLPAKPPADPAATGSAAVEEEATLNIQLFELEPALIIDLMPQLSEVVRWEGPVSGTVTTKFSLLSLPNSVYFALRVKEGRLRLPLTGGDLVFRSAQASGNLRLKERALVLDELNVAHATGIARLRGQGMLHDSGAAQVQLAASGLNLSWLSNLIPGASALAGADLSVAADIDASVMPDGSIGEATVRAETDRGLLTLPGFLPEPLWIGNSRLDLKIDDEGRRFALRNLHVALPTEAAERVVGVDVSGAAVRGGDGALTILTGGLDEFDLKRLWPIGLGEGARVWVMDQVSKGDMPEAKIDVTFRLPSDSPPQMPEDIRIDGRLKLHDVSLTYWPPLPIATGLNADARITESLFEANVTSGASAGMQVRGGRLTITGMDKGKGGERTDLEFDLSGPINGLMAILDRPPLRFARYLDLPPSELGGTIRGTLTAKFPPVADLALDDIEIGASGTSHDTHIPKAAFDQDLTAGHFSFKVDKSALKLDGEAMMAGAPVSLSGDVRFTPRAPFRSRFRLQSTVDDKARRALGFSDFPFSAEVVSGPVSIDMTATEQLTSGTLIEVAADLSKSRLALPLFNWQSPPGEFAAANAQVRVVDGQIRRVDSFRVTAPQLSVAGDAEWTGANGSSPVVNISEFRHGAGTNLTLVAEPSSAGDYRLSIGGQRLDARGLIETMAKPPANAGEAQSGGNDRLTVDLNIQEAQLGSGPPLNTVRGSVLLEGDRLQAAMLGAQTEGGGQIAVEIKPDGRAALSASDAGALLVALGVTERLDSGALQLNANIPPGPGAIAGTMQLRGGVLREAPFLMRLLSGDSINPPAIAKSWEVDLMETQFALNRGILSFEEGQIAGGELGATFRGWIDLNRDLVDMSGAIVPAYSVNRVLRAIPLLGDVLTGGEGLFAANYRATGPLAKPDFKINPLTALAPGLLRKLFGNTASRPPTGTQ